MFKLNRIIFILVFYSSQLVAQQSNIRYEAVNQEGKIDFNSTTPEVYWENSWITYLPNLNIDKPTYLDLSLVEEELDNALLWWENLGYYRFNKLVGPGQAVGVRFSNYLLHFENNANAPGGGAIAVDNNNYIQYYTENNKTINKYTGVFLNSTEAFLSNYNWVYILPSSSNEVHLKSIILHELGHILGLGHNVNTNNEYYHSTGGSVMVPRIGPGEYYVQLDQDDIDGIRTLYEKTISAVVVNYNPDKYYGYPNVVVKFKDISSGKITSWKWYVTDELGNILTVGTDYEFVNGTSYASQEPQIQFYNAIKYKIKLLVNDIENSPQIVHNSLQKQTQSTNEFSTIITILPEGTPYMSVSPKEFHISSEAQTNNIRVEIFGAQSSDVSVYPGASYLSMDHPTGFYTAPTDIIITASENTGFRTPYPAPVTISASSADLQIDAIQEVLIYQEPPGPRIEIIKDQTSIPYNGGSKEIYIQNSGTEGLHWSAKVDPTCTDCNWLDIVSPLDIVAEDGTLQLNVTQTNPDYTPRYASIWIESDSNPLKVIQIRQDGNPNIYNGSTGSTPPISANPINSYHKKEGVAQGYDDGQVLIGKDANNFIYRSTLNFNCSSVPKGALITKVELNLDFNYSSDYTYNIREYNYYGGTGTTTWQKIISFGTYKSGINARESLNDITTENLLDDLYDAVNYGYGFQLGIVSDDENLNVQLRSSTSAIPYIIVYYQGNVNVDQKDNAGDSFGSVLIWESSQNLWDYDNVPFVRTRSASVTLKAYQDFKPNTTELFYKWVDQSGNSTFKNYDDISLVSGGNNITAHFKPTVSNITIQNLFEGFPFLNSNSIWFKDPWLANVYDQTYGYSNKGENAIPLELESPFSVNESSDYKGIFLNQTADLGPIYAVENSQIQNFNGRDFKFIEWTGSNVNFTNKANLSTSVIFSSDNAVVSALYKGIHSTNNPSAFSNPNQRKIVRTQNGNLHMVYGSMGYVWYERSTDNGVTWEIANGGKPLGEGFEGSQPCIDYLLNNYILISYFIKSEDDKVFGIDLFNETGLIDKEFITDPVLLLGLQTTYSNPTIAVTYAGSPSIGKGLICWSNDDGIYYSNVEFDLTNNLFLPGSGYNKVAGTNSNSVKPSIIIDKAESHPVNSNHSFHLVWQQSETEIKHLEFSESTLQPIGTPATISNPAGYPKNLNPVVTVRDFNNNNFLPAVSWIGQNSDGTSSKVTERSKNQDGSWDSEFRYFGSNVASVDISSPTSGNDEVVIAWTENDGAAAKSVLRKSGVWGNTNSINAASPYLMLSNGNNSIDDIKAYYVNSASMPYQIQEAGLIYSNNISVDLHSGWNWISLNVIPPSWNINSIFSLTNYSDQDIIKNQISYSQYLNGNGWIGSLSELNANEMFKIKVSNEQSLSLTGEPINPSESNINLKSGWTWLSYLPNFPSNINYALQHLTANQGDVLKSQTGFSIYNSVNGWEGSLTDFYPGAGYLYNTPDSKNFKWNSIPQQDFSKRNNLAEYENSDAGWQLNPYSYEYNMCLIAEVKDLENQSLIAAFVGEECRGMTEPVYNKSKDGNLYYLMVYSNKTDGEEIQFKIYSAETGKKFAFREKVSFLSNAVIGSIKEPQSLNVSSEETAGLIPTNYELQQNYPNPFNPSTTITFSIPKENEVKIIVYNALGQEIKTILSSYLNAGYYKVMWDGKDDSGKNVSSGIYMYRIVSGDFTKIRKMVFLK